MRIKWAEVQVAAIDTDDNTVTMRIDIEGGLVEWVKVRVGEAVCLGARVDADAMAKANEAIGVRVHGFH